MAETIPYIDSKADDIKDFAMLSKMMWYRANYVLNKQFNKNEPILVIDPCAGGGKLLLEMVPAYIAKAYEPNYGPFTYAKKVFDEKNYNVEVVNQPFEFHFSNPYLPENHLVISIPYTDREINSTLETCKECRQFKNYAYYIMSKSMDVLQEGGFGVFAIPATMVDREKFKYEIGCITDKASLLSIEQFGDYAMIILQKEKLK